MKYYPNKIQVDKVLNYLKDKFRVKTMRLTMLNQEINYIILSSEKSLYLNTMFNSKKLAKYKLLLEIKDYEELKDISDASLFKGIKNYINLFY